MIRETVHPLQAACKRSQFLESARQISLSRGFESILSILHSISLLKPFQAKWYSVVTVTYMSILTPFEDDLDTMALTHALGVVEVIVLYTSNHYSRTVSSEPVPLELLPFSIDSRAAGHGVKLRLLAVSLLSTKHTSSPTINSNFEPLLFHIKHPSHPAP